MTNDSMFDLLITAIEYGADWRDQKSAEFPADARNLTAANRLRRLASEVKALGGEHPLVTTYCAVRESSDDPAMSEVESGCIRDVGFRAFPDCAEQFLSNLVGEMRTRLVA